MPYQVLLQLKMWHCSFKHKHWAHHGGVPIILPLYLKAKYIIPFYRTRVRSLGMLVSDWPTDCCLVNLIDVTLACEDGNSKLVAVVTVVEVDDEKRVDNSLVQIWKVNFGHKVKFLFGLWGQGFKVCSRFWSWCSGKILKLKFGHYFAADAWLWLWSSFLVEILVWFGPLCLWQCFVYFRQFLFVFMEI